MIISKEKANALLQPFIETIATCIENAILEYNEINIKYRIRFTPRSKANIINDFIVANAKLELPKLDSVHVSDCKNPFSVYIGDYFKLRFKKFNCCLRPLYIPTIQMKSLLDQIPMTNMPEQVTNILAGYVWRDATHTQRDIYITCPNGKQNAWELKITVVKAPTLVDNLTGSDGFNNRRVFPKDN